MLFHLYWRYNQEDKKECQPDHLSKALTTYMEISTGIKSFKILFNQEIFIG
jgi:hypothetical protein